MLFISPVIKETFSLVYAISNPRPVDATANVIIPKIIIFFTVPTEPDKERSPNDIFFWHKPPKTTVIAVVPIVPHDKIMIRWDDYSGHIS